MREAHGEKHTHLSTQIMDSETGSTAKVKPNGPLARWGVWWAGTPGVFYNKQFIPVPEPLRRPLIG